MSMLIIAVYICSQRIPIVYLEVPSCSGLYSVVSSTTYPKLSASLASFFGLYSLPLSIRHFLITLLN